MYFLTLDERKKIVYNKSMELLIPVAAGLEQTVKRQLNKLGYDKCPAENGRIAVDGDWKDVARLNVFLRSGERVLVKVASFKAVTFDELYQGMYAVSWENYLEMDSQILMDGKCFQSTLGAIKACGGVAKKAIISRLADKKKTGRKTFTESGARTIVGFSIIRDVVTVTLDTTGDGLHKRGYRTLSVTAPLKETLAAAILDNTFYNPEKDSEKPLADPFCGSGTFPIEAALKALNIAPGIRRSFDFERWSFVPKDAIALAREEAKDGETRNRQVMILGSDINPKNVEIAKKHAWQAGVADSIRFSVADARKFSCATPFGILVCNPPYGERLSELKEVQALMRDFANAFRALPDWNAYVLTSLPEFERWFGKNADKKKKLSNANLVCGLYSYFGKSPKARFLPLFYLFTSSFVFLRVFLL
ncbi:MAG: class I SAM-dependent RNA methyltransferase [Clostridia bacterium]|nr:class I SAM-dependent RNA methyltransferase [Clostridia bacterium]